MTTLADGELTRVADRWQLRFVRDLPHPPEKVWRALTEPEHQAAWFPDEMRGERAVGAPLHFVSREMPHYPGFDGTMLVYEPPETLEFLWGTDVLRFELSPSATGTVLTLIDTFEEQGKAARDGAGWHVCLEQLGFALDGDEPPWKPEEHWGEVNSAYVEALGPEASTLGPPQEWIDAHK
jgi:uncharacterized protein YndB with AHSA1/START domain